MSNYIPEIRFKGFTHAWEQRKLGEMAEETYGGGTPSTSNEAYWNGTIPWIQSSDLVEHQLFGVSPRKYITESGVHSSATKLVPKNSIAIVTRVGVGKLATMPFAFATSQDFLSLSNLKCEIGFCAYSIYKKLQRDIDSVQGTSIKGITKNELLSKSIYAPSDISEQTTIGNFFRTLDDTITLYKRKLDKMKELKKGYLQKMFPQTGESVPMVRFSGFTEPWQQRRLGDMLKVNSGRDYKHLNSGNIPVYGTGGYMLSVDKSLSEIDAIGIGRKGTIDKPQLLIAPFWTVDTLFFMTPIHNHNLLFLYALSQSIGWANMDESTGVPSLSKANIDNIARYIPENSEQTAIGNFFRTLDKQTAVQQQKLIQLKQLKSAYLQKMFL